MRSRGFTLIEVVLATAILALIMSLVFSTFFAQNKVEKAARSEIEADQAARVFLEQIMTDLSQTLSPGKKGLAEPPLSGKSIKVERCQGHELTLLSRSGGDEPVVRIIYRTAAGRREDGTPSGDLSVFRRIEPLLGGDPVEEAICPGVGAWAVTYLDKEAKETESWSDEENLPVGLKVELMLVAEGRPKTYSLFSGPLAALTWSRSE